MFVVFVGLCIWGRLGVQHSLAQVVPRAAPQGYTELTDMICGFGGWLSAGLPTEK